MSALVVQQPVARLLVELGEGQSSTLVAVQETAQLTAVAGQGPAGPGAYELAVSVGFVGTEQQWLDSLASGENEAWPDLALIFENAII